MNRRFVVITSINPPTQAIREFASWPGWTTIVVGDRKSPPDWSSKNVVYLSLQDQDELAPSFARYIPENTYIRKMIGYIYAFKMGAEAIFESDDDNIPYAGSYLQLNSDLAQRGFITPSMSSATGWLNTYEAFGAKKCWPRGFPLHLLASSTTKEVTSSTTALPWGILQYLADLDPDVDAIYRMTNNDPVYFAREKKLSLARRCFSPFNSQATLWVPETYPLMFLPLGVKDRVTDILRGYAALACLWANDTTLAYASPLVFQVRNKHDLLKDFEQEIDLYRYGDDWCKKLVEVPGDGMANSYGAALEMLVTLKVISDTNLQAYSEFKNLLPKSNQ